MESWKPIAGYEGRYEISSHGRVKSLSSRFRRGQAGKDRILQPGLCWGYHVVRLCMNSQGKMHRVHRLVAFAFLPKSKHRCVNHKDGNKTNNRVDNLEWVSYWDNNAHAFHTGLRPLKLTNAQYQELFVDRASGMTYRQIAEKYGLSTMYVTKLIRGRSGLMAYSRS